MHFLASESFGHPPTCCHLSGRSRVGGLRPVCLSHIVESIKRIGHTTLPGVEELVDEVKTRCSALRFAPEVSQARLEDLDEVSESQRSHRDIVCK